MSDLSQMSSNDLPQTEDTSLPPTEATSPSLPSPILHMPSEPVAASPHEPTSPVGSPPDSRPPTLPNLPGSAPVSASHPWNLAAPAASSGTGAGAATLPSKPMHPDDRPFRTGHPPTTHHHPHHPHHPHPHPHHPHPPHHHMFVHPSRRPWVAPAPGAPAAPFSYYPPAQPGSAPAPGMPPPVPAPHRTPSSAHVFPNRTLVNRLASPRASQPLNNHKSAHFIPTLLPPTSLSSSSPSSSLSSLSSASAPHKRSHSHYDHYFDVQQYQEDVNRRKAEERLLGAPEKKRKVTKKEIAKFKAKKEEQKKRKFMAKYSEL